MRMVFEKERDCLWIPMEIDTKEISRTEKQTELESSPSIMEMSMKEDSKKSTFMEKERIHENVVGCEFSQAK